MINITTESVGRESANPKPGLDDPEYVARAVDPRAKRSGKGWLCICPVDQKPKGSLHVSPGTKGARVVFHCFRCPYEVVRAELIRLGLISGQLTTPATDVMLYGNRVNDAMNKRVWKGLSGATDRAVLIACLEIMKKCSKLIFGASIRELAEAAGVGKSTIPRAIRRLVTAGWLRPVDPPDKSTSLSATYQLAIPERVHVVGHSRDNSSTKSVPLNPLLTFDTFDIFRYNALGKKAARIYETLSEPLTIKELAYRMVCDPHNLYTKLRRMKNVGLITQTADGRLIRLKTPEQVAAEQAIPEYSRIQKEQHLKERELWKLQGALRVTLDEEGLAHGTDSYYETDQKTGETLRYDSAHGSGFRRTLGSGDSDCQRPAGGMLSFVAQNALPKDAVGAAA